MPTSTRGLEQSAPTILWEGLEKNRHYLIETDTDDVNGTPQWVAESEAIVSLIRQAPGSQELDWAASSLQAMVKQKLDAPDTSSGPSSAR